MLVGPVAADIAHSSRILVVPDGPIHNLPFDCLPDANGRFLIQSHAISILPEASVVPSGVVHLMELQEKGWSYVKP